MTDYISNIKKNFSLSNILMMFFIVFLPIFSFVIFGPAEIFFTNYSIFGVVFREFGATFFICGTLSAIIITFLMLFFPAKLRKIILSALWLFSICGYIQTMFLNKNLDQIGATLAGYVPATEVIMKNFLIWLVVIIVGALLIIKSKEKWHQLLFFSSLALVAMQGIAYGTLLISAPKASTEYVASDYYLSGEKQYTVSSESNVIVFILDTLSNIHFSVAQAKYPDITASFSDFTYYNNTDCNYVGTFPSVVHILTGNDFDPSISTNEWFYETWTNDNTTNYYQSLHEAGYQVNVFANEYTVITGADQMSLLQGKVDNLTDQAQHVAVNHPLLYKTLLAMSCYRFMPDYFKPLFDVPNAQYASIATYPDNVINYANPDFYSDLLNKGLTINEQEKYVTFYHLNGIHELINDEYCNRVDSCDDVADTIKGIWVMLEEYLMQLEDLGVYDNSTIIITADHGSHDYPQSVFFMKEANAHHTEMQVNSAPISLDELAPTIAQIVTNESSYLGHTIYDFDENTPRERILYIGTHDERYPDVIRYDGTPITGNNTYRLYTYTGNFNDYYSLYQNDIFDVIPTVDSYY